MSQSNVSQSRLSPTRGAGGRSPRPRRPCSSSGSTRRSSTSPCPTSRVSLHATERPAPVVRRQLPAGARCAAAARRGCSATGTGGSARRWSAWSCSSPGRSGARWRRAPAASSRRGRCSVSVPRSSSRWRCRRSSSCSTPKSAPGRSPTLGISTMVGLPLGPIVAGVLLQHFWWGSVFVVNLPVIALALVAVLLFLPETVGSPRPPAGPGRHTPHLRRDARRDVRRHRGAGARVDGSAGGGRAGRWRGVVRGRSCGGSDATAASSRSSTRRCGASRRSGGAP